jgi:hypothetical protein
MGLRIKLFRRISKVQRFVIIKGDMIHAYLGYSIITVQKQRMGIV